MRCICCTNESKEGCKLCQTCINYRINYNKTHIKQTRKIQKNYRITHKTQIKDFYSSLFKEYKNKILNHYGHKCTCCGESTYEFLAVDHINGEGRKHRESLGKNGSSGRLFYKWIIDNNYPKNLQILCWNCNWAKWRFGTCPHKVNI